jgi:HEAT repeat protein
MAELTGKQSRAIAALLVTKSVAEASKRCGVGARTIERWKTEPAFRAEYIEASRRCLADAVGRLRAVGPEAVDTLQAALSDESNHVRVRAAQIILDVAIKAEVDDLARRLEALEGAQAGGPR